jgi:hypothetical protein
VNQQNNTTATSDFFNRIGQVLPSRPPGRHVCC